MYVEGGEVTVINKLHPFHTAQATMGPIAVTPGYTAFTVLILPVPLS